MSSMTLIEGPRDEGQRTTKSDRESAVATYYGEGLSSYGTRS